MFLDRAAAAFGTFALIGTGRIRQSEQSFLPPSFQAGHLVALLNPHQTGSLIRRRHWMEVGGLTNVDIARKFYKI